ncbi:uncharacterized protein LOC133794801 [Humulus lupulus]|uniref:uncharacterized protein LOC133794801 n=1 Tax=Humulus lupulus TaxID=3486 RepID=UPI002B40BEBB|nr:uncharacterized protein LOC133794801 [Humulus lupulus]
MENDNLDEWERRCNVSKEMSRLYEVCYEEKKKVEELQRRIENLENENKEIKDIKERARWGKNAVKWLRRHMKEQNQVIEILHGEKLKLSEKLTRLSARDSSV